jgi:hypothetical protein
MHFVRWRLDHGRPQSGSSSLSLIKVGGGRNCSLCLIESKKISVCCKLSRIGYLELNTHFPKNFWWLPFLYQMTSTLLSKSKKTLEHQGLPLLLGLVLTTSVFQLPSNPIIHFCDLPASKDMTAHCLNMTVFYHSLHFYRLLPLMLLCF